MFLSKANLVILVFTGTCPWSDFVYKEQPPNASFWFRSAFGQYCHAVFTFCEEKNAEIISDAEDEYPLNPYYSKEFSDYLRTWFLPYYPIISHMVLVDCNVSLELDTNNAIEGYFKLLKTNLYRNVRQEKLPRFIRQQSEYIKGKFFKLKFPV